MLLVEGLMVAIFAFFVILWYTREYKEQKNEENSELKKVNEPFSVKTKKKVNQFLNSAAEETTKQQEREDQKFYDDSYRLNIYKSLKYNMRGSINFPGQRRNPYSIDDKMFRRRLYRNLSRNDYFRFPFWTPFVQKEELDKSNKESEEDWTLKQYQFSIPIFLHRIWLKLKKIFHPKNSE
jgi:hypothetical protein